MIFIRLKEIAEAQGYNLSRLQKASGVDMGVLRRYWNWDGSLYSLHLPSVERLARLLNIQPGELLVMIDDPSRRNILERIPAQQQESTHG